MLSLVFVWQGFSGEKNPLVKRVDGFQSRSGCGSSGSAGQAQDGPARAQEGRLKLGHVSLLQVQVTSRGGAVKHLLGGTAGKQGTWGEQLKMYQDVLLFF